MSKDILKINSYVMDDVSSYTSMTKNNIEGCGDTCERNFAVMKSGTLFNNGINKINKQFQDLTSRLNYLNNTFKSQTEDFFNLEKTLNDEAMQLEIPTDFETTDSAAAKEFKELNLSKHDGRSVNEGKALFDNTTEFDSSVKEMQSLNNITNDFESSEEEINKYTENKTMMNNITRDTNMDFKNLEEYNNTENVQIKNINNNGNVNFDVNDQILDNIDINGGGK